MIDINPPNTNMNTKDTPFTFTFDKLSRCYTDPNIDHVKQTRALLKREKLGKVHRSTPEPVRKGTTHSRRLFRDFRSPNSPAIHRG